MWEVILHKLVLDEDLKRIDKKSAADILKAIRKKLTQDPEGYGNPLLGEYKGYWKLRVGDFRVVYRIVKERIVVIVIKVGIRRDNAVYDELSHRLKKI